jgi:hypothetical protein
MSGAGGKPTCGARLLAIHSRNAPPDGSAGHGLGGIVDEVSDHRQP